MMKKILVFDGRSRAALSIIRSLGKRGVHIVAGEAFMCSSFYSKYTREKIIYPPPDKDPECFKSFMFDYLGENKIDLIIPVRDDITEIVINNQEKFSTYTSFLAPRQSAFNATRDKAETIKLARKLGVPHPKTILTKEEDSSLEILKKEFDLPALIKPRISSGSRGIIVVNNWDDFQVAYDKIHAEFPYPMIQEFIPHGGAYGVSMLYKSGKSKASFTHKRIREFPISGGPSTLREGVHYEEIENYSSRLLDELKWNGVAMVEYRIDKNSGKPRLMEINPRFWGSLETAVFSGIDFPYLLYQLVTTGDCEDSFQYTAGIQVRWLLFGDILWFVNSKKNWHNIKAFFQFKKKNLSYDIFSWKDIGPSIGAFIEAFNSFMKSERRKHAFKRGWN
jgi:predicted ATP-grasp superfamily ATP-dependent carboligase